MAVIRGVAQSGRVLALGARCRRFESFRPDQKLERSRVAAVFFVQPPPTAGLTVRNGLRYSGNICKSPHNIPKHIQCPISRSQWG